MLQKCFASMVIIDIKFKNRKVTGVEMKTPVEPAREIPISKETFSV